MPKYRVQLDRLYWFQAEEMIVEATDEDEAIELVLQETSIPDPEGLELQEMTNHDAVEEIIEV